MHTNYVEYNVRTVQIKIRVNKDDKEALARRAEKLGISLSGLFRMSFSIYQSSLNGRKLRIDRSIETGKGGIILLMADPKERASMQKAAKKESLTLSRFLRSLVKMQMQQK